MVEFALQYGFQIQRGVCDVVNSRHIHPGEPCQMLRLVELVTTKPQLPIPDTAQHWKDLLL